MSVGKRSVRRRGDIVKIDLGHAYCYAYVLRKPLFAFLDVETEIELSVSQLLEKRILFTVAVMDYAVTKGRWTVIGKIEQSSLQHLEKPIFFKQDKFSKKLTAYSDVDGSEWPISFEEAENLEAAAVWDPSHVEDRLRDHFAGRENLWLASLRPKRLTS